MASVLGALTAAARSVRWWTGALMGDHDYARYVAHLRRRHPGAEIPTEREYWRARYADAETNPGPRCC